MTFQFDAKRSTTKNTKRILNNQLDFAVAALKGKDKDKGVHEARKTMKRVRSLLRLVREPLGRKIYRRENAFFRDVARDLSGARDRYVLVKTFDRLVKQHNERIRVDKVAPIRDHLLAQYEAVHTGFSQDGLAPVINSLYGAKQRVALLKLDNKGFDDLEQGLRQIYGGGRVQVSIVKKATTAENLHEWRKNVKYLWHQVELLSATWEPVLSSYANALHELADCLGDDHDYAVLRFALLELPAEVGEGEVIYGLSRLIESERERLQQRAFLMGAYIYAEESHAFVERMRSYWDVWQDFGNHDFADI